MTVSTDRTRPRAVVVRAADPRAGVRAALTEIVAAASSAVRPRVCVAVGIGSAAFVSPEVVAEALSVLAEAGMVPPVVHVVIPVRDRDAGWDLESLCVRHDLAPAGLVDAWDVVEPATVDDAHVIQGRPVPTDWQQADVRVVLAPCATDAIDGQALVLDVLRALVPTIAGADPVDLVTDVLQTMPPDLSVLDATVTSGGPAGTSVRRPIATDTLVAASSAILADIVGATMLGADPLRSPLMSSVVDLMGMPQDFDIQGELTRFAGVDYPPEPLLRATRAGSASVAVNRVVSAALADEGVTTSGDDVVMALLRQALRPLVATSAASPTTPAALGWTGASAAAVAAYARAWQTTFSKDSVPRRRASLGLDLARYRAGDYEASVTDLRPLLRLIEELPVDSDGLRWMHVDGAVVFEASRTVEAAYDDWIARVDVAKAISLMADYLGGRTVVVARDGQGRTVRQAERNIYLPQPNYIAFSGGDVIDVCKLSVVRHRARDCSIWWRTVRSPNRSAVHDDGTVEFADAGDGRTRVVVRGRQQFTLPEAMRAVDLDLAPDVRDSLTQDAYRRFFLTTLDNFEACFEGRDFAIGHDPDGELPTKGLSRLAKVAESSLTELLASTPGGASDPAVRVRVDDAGFTHVTGTRR